MAGTNPLENCIIAIRADLSNYLTDNDNREETKTQCCLFRMHLAGHDSVLAGKKKALAENMVYTFDQILIHDQTARARFENYEPRDAAKLAYDAFCQGFARILDCVQGGIETEHKLNSNRAGAGLLSQALRRSSATFDREWVNAKEAIWNTQALHGPDGKFENIESNKDYVLRSFDTDMNNKRHLFTAVMTKPLYTNMGTFAPSAPPPPFYEQPAYTTMKL